MRPTATLLKESAMNKEASEKISAIKNSMMEFIEVYRGRVSCGELYNLTQRLSSVDSARLLYRELCRVSRLLTSKDAELLIEDIKRELKMVRILSKGEELETERAVEVVKSPRLPETEDYKKVLEFVQFANSRGVDRSEVLEKYRDLMHSYRRK